MGERRGGGIETQLTLHTIQSSIFGVAAVVDAPGLQPAVPKVLLCAVTRYVIQPNGPCPLTVVGIGHGYRYVASVNPQTSQRCNHCPW